MQFRPAVSISEGVEVIYTPFDATWPRLWAKMVGLNVAETIAYQGGGFCVLNHCRDSLCELSQKILASRGFV